VYLGIDLGTSAVKAVLMREDGSLEVQASSVLDVSRPKPLWSEQDPEHWWTATNDAVAQLRASHAAALGAVKGIGLSGQMHGATLLDAQDRVLRPAILWNDGRSGDACKTLEAAEPRSRKITGNIAMPGFTAPKLVWLKQHEPDVFARVAKVLLPKDFVRLRMTGEYASDLSDSAGTLWLDVEKRTWSDAMLQATDLSTDHMPRLFEGTEVTGTLRDSKLRRRGAYHPCPSRAVAAITRQARQASVLSSLVPDFFRWGHRACCSLRTGRTSRIRKAACTRFAIAFPGVGIRWR
jgi:xylulokinase